MSNKIYKVSADHLNALGEAAVIIVAFLDSIKADEALISFSAAQALNKLRKSEAVPATLEQAVDEAAEKYLAALDAKGKKAIPRHCHCVKGGKHGVCAPTPTLMELAESLGVAYKTIQVWAAKNKVGKTVRDAKGHLQKKLTRGDVAAIRARFGK